jgi:hypothetical protein
MKRFLALLARLALLALLAPVLAALPRPAGAQEREVRFTPAARHYLIAQWDTTHANQPERGYCLAVVPAMDRLPNDTVDVVIGVFRAVAKVANPIQVAFNCGPVMRYLHVHTPTTCGAVAPDPDPILAGQMVVDDCRLGGPGNGLCYPSEGDLRMLSNYAQPWGLIQCGADAFITYYRNESGGLYPQ